MPPDPPERVSFAQHLFHTHTFTIPKRFPPASVKSCMTRCGESTSMFHAGQDCLSLTSKILRGSPQIWPILYEVYEEGVCAY